MLWEVGLLPQGDPPRFNSLSLLSQFGHFARLLSPSPCFFSPFRTLSTFLLPGLCQVRSWSNAVTPGNWRRAEQYCPLAAGSESRRRGGCDLPCSADSRGGLPVAGLGCCQAPCWDSAGSALWHPCRNGGTSLISDKHLHFILPGVVLEFRSRWSSFVLLSLLLITSCNKASSWFLLLDF